MIFKKQELEKDGENARNRVRRECETRKRKIKDIKSTRERESDKWTKSMNKSNIFY